MFALGPHINVTVGGLEQTIITSGVLVWLSCVPHLVMSICVQNNVPGRDSLQNKELSRQLRR